MVKRLTTWQYMLCELNIEKGFPCPRKSIGKAFFPNTLNKKVWHFQIILLLFVVDWGYHKLIIHGVFVQGSKLKMWKFFSLLKTAIVSLCRNYEPRDVKYGKIWDQWNIWKMLRKGQSNEGKKPEAHTFSIFPTVGPNVWWSK